MPEIKHDLLSLACPALGRTRAQLAARARRRAVIVSCLCIGVVGVVAVTRIGVCHASCRRTVYRESAVCEHRTRRAATPGLGVAHATVCVSHRLDQQTQLSDGDDGAEGSGTRSRPRGPRPTDPNKPKSRGSGQRSNPARSDASPQTRTLAPSSLCARSQSQTVTYGVLLAVRLSGASLCGRPTLAVKSTKTRTTPASAVHPPLSRPSARGVLARILTRPIRLQRPCPFQPHTASSVLRDDNLWSSALCPG